MSLLKLSHISAFYGPSQALFDVHLDVAEGQVVALMGRNGMGKSTTVKVICRMLKNRGGAVVFDGKDIARQPSHKAAQAGIGLVPEGRRCFAQLTVYENLIAAARPGEWDFAKVSELFPRLAERRDQLASSLSGGEQQMLATGRALCINPSVLLLDEPTEGLQPSMIEQIRQAVTALRDRGVAILLVEQRVDAVLSIADRVVFLENGRSHDPVSAAALRDDPDLLHRFVGV
jgi:branched-chain amino acid transport system ATP-binding protein